jgi:hypothetical protein
MNITVIQQRIKVGAVFEDELITPKWFKWMDKKYDLKNVSMRWKSFSGSAVIIHFSTTDGKNLYELRFNQKSLEWTLDKIGAE